MAALASWIFVRVSVMAWRRARTGFCCAAVVSLAGGEASDAFATSPYVRLSPQVVQAFGLWFMLWHCLQVHVRELGGGGWLLDGRTPT